VLGKDGWLHIFNADSLQPTAQIGGTNLRDVAAVGPGREVWAATHGQAGLCRVDPARGAMQCGYAPTLPGAPFELFCPGSGYTCYLSDMSGGSRVYSVLIGENAATALSETVGFFSAGLAIDARKRHLFVARPLSGVIDVLGSDFNPIRSLPAAPMVAHISYAPSLDTLFAPEYFSGKVHAVDAATGRSTTIFHVGTRVRKVLWSESRGELFVMDRARIYRFGREEISSLLGRR